MWASLFGNQQANNKQNPSSKGVGYGGSSMDNHALCQARSTAVIQQIKDDARLVAFFLESAKGLRQKRTLPDSQKLVDALKRVFHDLIPSEWGTRSKIMIVSLSCFSRLIQDRPDLLGDVHQADSLASAFEGFCKYAQFLAEHAHVNDQPAIVERILQLQQSMHQGTGKPKGTLHRGDKGGDSPAQIYRKRLGPLCFDLCESLANHAFASEPRPAKLNTRALFRYLASLREALPVTYGSSIFVRAVEGRLDLLRALIIGSDDTPYANGCYLFDLQLYDLNQPPRIKFLTTGDSLTVINPNLYNNGKVCLSLLGTWPGPGWIPGESTLLQVLVSIQSLILVAQPVHNEPVLMGLAPNFLSRQYNINVRRHTLRRAIFPMLSSDNNPYPEFHDVMQEHFRVKRDEVRAQCIAWLAEDLGLKHLVPAILTQIKQIHRSKWDKVGIKRHATSGTPEPDRKRRKTAE